MLQYDGQDHLVFGIASIDYTIRMKQFFDHFLKNAPPPLWMTKGIPAMEKGISNGFDLDLRVKALSPGLLYKKSTTLNSDNMTSIH